MSVSPPFFQSIFADAVQCQRARTPHAADSQDSCDHIHARRHEGSVPTAMGRTEADVGGAGLLGGGELAAEARRGRALREALHVHGIGGGAAHLR